jgi:hypothetical protein
VDSTGSTRVVGNALGAIATFRFQPDGSLDWMRTWEGAGGTTDFANQALPN